MDVLDDPNLIDAKQGFSAGYLIRRPLLHGASYVMDLLRPWITSATQIDDNHNVLQNNELAKRPGLLVFKHETTLDLINGMQIWRRLPSKPDIKFVAKQFKGIQKILAAPFWQFFLQVQRMKPGKKKTEEERKRMIAASNVQLEKIKRSYSQGVYGVILPEGTTNTDGTVFPIGSGCYNLSHIRTGGRTYTIPILPVGITYDFFAGGKNWITGKPRYLAFFNFGEPFTYSPVKEGNNFIKRDIHHHANRVLDALIDCNTFTVAQIAGEYILNRALAGEDVLTRNQIQHVVRARVDRLCRLEGLVFDNALLEERTRGERTDAFFRGIREKGYFTGDTELCIDKVVFTPDDNDYDGYKQENPLRYSANRLIQIRSRRPHLDEALHTSDGEVR